MTAGHPPGSPGRWVERAPARLVVSAVTRVATAARSAALAGRRDGDRLAPVQGRLDDEVRPFDVDGAEINVASLPSPWEAGKAEWISEYTRGPHGEPREIVLRTARMGSDNRLTESIAHLDLTDPANYAIARPFLGTPMPRSFPFGAARQALLDADRDARHRRAARLRGRGRLARCGDRCRGARQVRPRRQARRDPPLARPGVRPAGNSHRKAARLRNVESMKSSMRAVVLDAPGPPEALQIRELPVPEPERRVGADRGQGLRAQSVRAADAARARGLAVTFPRVLGIEAAGVVAACPGGEFAVGQQVVAMMGGMGRQFDGGYAEYTCVPGRAGDRVRQRPRLGDDRRGARRRCRPRTGR